MGEDSVRPEALGHGALGLEAGDHPDLHARVEGLEDGHAREAQGTGAVDEHPPGRGRRVPHDGVEGHGEGVGEDGRLVGDAVGDGDQHGVVRRQLLGPGAGRSGDDADVHPGAEVTLREAPAEAQVPAWQGGQSGSMPRGAQVNHGLSTTRWPTSSPRASGPSGDDLGHDLVPGDVGQRGEGGHRIIDIARVEVAQHQLGVGAADTREDRPGDHPVGPDEAGVVDVVQTEGDAGQHRLQLVLGGGPDLLLVRWCAEEQRLHVPSLPGRPGRRMPTMKLSMSDVLASMIAFMSGR